MTKRLTLIRILICDDKYPEGPVFEAHVAPRNIEEIIPTYHTINDTDYPVLLCRFVSGRTRMLWMELNHDGSQLVPLSEEYPQ